MGSQPKYKNEEWLRQKYVEENMTMKQMAEEADVCAATIGDHLKENNIKTRHSGQRTYIKPKYRNREWLRKQHFDEERTNKEIAEECNVSTETIRDWLIQHRIGRVPVPDPDKEYQHKSWLVKHRIDEELKVSTIAEKAGVTKSKIKKWLRWHNVNKDKPDNRLPERVV
jgi:hypothetical protein